MLVCEETSCHHFQVAICLHCTKKLCIHHIEHHQKSLLTQLDQIKDQVNRLKITISNASNTMIEQRKIDEEKCIVWRQEKLSEIDREYDRMISPIRDRQKKLEEHESLLHQRLEVEVEQVLEQMLTQGTINDHLIDVIQSSIQRIEKESVTLKWKDEESKTTDQCDTVSKDVGSIQRFSTKDNILEPKNAHHLLIIPKANLVRSSKDECSKRKRKVKTWRPKNIFSKFFRSLSPYSAVHLYQFVWKKMTGQNKIENLGLITLIFSYLCTWYKLKEDRWGFKWNILRTHIWTVQQYVIGRNCEEKVLIALEYFFNRLENKGYVEIEMMTMLLQMFLDYQCISLPNVIQWYSNQNWNPQVMDRSNDKRWAEPFLTLHGYQRYSPKPITYEVTKTISTSSSPTASTNTQNKSSVKNLRICKPVKGLVKCFRNQSDKNNVLALGYIQKNFTTKISNRVIMMVRAYLMVWNEYPSKTRKDYLLRKISLVKHFKDDPQFELQLIYAIELFFTQKQKDRKWLNQSVSTVRQFFLDQECLTEETISKWDSEGPFYDVTHYQETKSLNEPFLERLLTNK